MRFEREINIYGDEVILKRFTANETSISVIQGEISAIISESELIELIDSSVTMYSKLASAIMDIDSLTINFSDLTTKYNTVSGQYTALDSKVAEYKASVDGLSANVSQISQNLTNNYSTTTSMNSAIDLKINQFSTSVSQTYVTNSNLENNYSTTVATQSLIDMRINQFSVSVSSTYATKTELNTANGKIESLEEWQSEASLKITDSAIISTVITSSSYENSVESLIEQNADSIRLKADRISWESTYSSMSENGTLNCQNAIINGTIHNITGNHEIYMRNANLQIINDGKFVGYIGTGDSGYNAAKKALAFRLEDEGSYMTWTSKENGNNVIKWTYVKDSGTFQNMESNTLHAGCNVNLRNYVLKNAVIEDIASDGYYGQTGYLPVVVRYTESGVTIESVVNLRISNGIIIGGAMSE